MFDTVNLRLGSDHLPPDHIPRTMRYLYGVKETQDNESGHTYYSGYLDSLKVYVTPRSVSIKEGSLCKYYLDSNLKGLQRKDVQAAIEKISDELHLPFHQSQVTRMDIAHNMIMREPHGTYYSLLGESTRYKRLEQPAALYYTKHNATKVFYDKLGQMKSNREKIPDHYRNQNVLRYELRYKNRLPKHFNKPQVLGMDLFDEKFYIQCVDQWVKEYTDIKKLNISNSIMTPTGSAKEFFDRFAMEGIKAFGISNAMTLIQAWKDAGHITRKQFYDLRQKIDVLSSSHETDQVNQYVQELDNKVRQVTQFYK